MADVRCPYCGRDVNLALCLFHLKNGTAEDDKRCPRCFAELPIKADAPLTGNPGKTKTARTSKTTKQKEE